MALSVTPASREDAFAIAELLDELDRFYGAADIDPVPQRAAHIEMLLFDGQPAGYVLLARQDCMVVGLATYSYLWPAAGISRSLFLKELYVASGHRRRGVGRLLMDHVRRIATESGCSRVEWMTDHDNPDAQRFYEQLGVPRHHGKIFYRMPVNEGTPAVPCGTPRSASPCPHRG